jgi:hypothetical protein
VQDQPLPGIFRFDHVELASQRGSVRGFRKWCGAHTAPRSKSARSASRRSEGDDSGKTKVKTRNTAIPLSSTRISSFT